MHNFDNETEVAEDERDVTPEAQHIERKKPNMLAIAGQGLWFGGIAGAAILGIVGGLMWGFLALSSYSAGLDSAVTVLLGATIGVVSGGLLGLLPGAFLGMVLNLLFFRVDPLQKPPLTGKRD